MSRAQLDHVLLDVDFFNNPKIRALKGKFGHISQLCLIDAYTAMSRATNAIIDGDCVMAILSDYQLKWDFWEHCLDKGLVKIEGQGYSNSRVIADQERLGKSQDKWRVANGKRKVDSNSTPNLHPINTQSKQNTVNVHGCEVLNTEELNLNIIKEEPHIIKAVSRWAEHRRKIGKPLDQMAIDSLILLYRGRFNELPDDIDHSISNGWKTLNAKPRHQPKVFKPPDPPIRKTINNYIPPTIDEKKRPSEESKARVRALIESSLERKRGEND